MSLFQVCYTQENYIQVRVHSEVFDPLTRQHKTTNVFHFTFVSDRDVPSIIPKTYGGKHTPGYQRTTHTIKRSICEAETNQVKLQVTEFSHHRQKQKQSEDVGD